MKIRNKEFDFKNEAYIMGILNVTPDSFSDGGKWNNVDNAVKHVEDMINEGASIIDIGAESTRPGYTPITSEEELERLIPIIRKIRENFDIPLSIDTFKAETFKEVVKEGVDVLNDIWGLKSDCNMAKYAKELETPVILMHNKHNNNYDDLMQQLNKETLESVELAKNAGIREDLIILDPGIGFALDYEKDLTVVNRIKEFVNLGYPVLLGTSRKRFIGKAMGIDVALNRDFGTAITTAIGVMNGCSIFRVHNVKDNYQAMKMALAIKREGR
ncbi:dihydropteroate synthase [uncultured Finegoldia sp.]|uniref:dihydropteroate synthase n=1 Tax=uncultured Finegoldia sp. TaxID=328009 RepID=UPI00260F322B|nr:dihydropteroate synthase [uncultured Finegoldia sp.]